ncbi:hypothetical protein K492DRAFT_194513 [Lichtheimia hyalospora FSU 10163]|nr:hypothetical protein K492DRAFT_194513 [Lichtheimia hyalospora FSU 10163]
MAGVVEVTVETTTLIRQQKKDLQLPGTLVFIGISPQQLMPLLEPLQLPCEYQSSSNLADSLDGFSTSQYLVYYSIKTWIICAYAICDA